jgi:16S rRNA (guanine966-N2)-methyltransferase
MSARGRGDASSRAHRVRIIGGRWKRTPLSVPDIEGLRPSPDRVRETLFNWIGPAIAGQRVLDLFAGTGALGLESLSRGATRAILVERDPRACVGIRSVVTRLGAEQAHLIEGDALAALDGFAQRSERFTLVFLDPPFRQDWLIRVLPGVGRVLAPRALLYVESERRMAAEEIDQGLGIGAEVDLVRSDKAGQVHYHLFVIESCADPRP